MKNQTTQTQENQKLREILKRVRRIEIRSRRAVLDTMGGEYHSAFKGRGMEFDEVREYAPGDEIRDIDWNVTARTGKPFLKRYIEEREQTVFFLVDISASTHFGTYERTKAEIAAEICALLAFSAIQNNDRVGLLTFTDNTEKYITPKKGAKHVLHVIREILFNQPQGKTTNIPQAISTLNKVLKKRAIVFLVSDFLAPDLRKSLMLANRRHDLIAIHLHDQREETLPSAGILELHDPETNQTIAIDTSSKKTRDRYAEANRRRLLELKKLLRSLAIDNITINTHQDYLNPITQFFRQRAKKR